MKYKRILLKLSGEALMGKKQYGIDAERLNQYSEDIKQVVWLLVHGSLQLPKNPESILDLLEF